MTRFRAVLAYDGTDYCGFQRQRNQPSVQEAVEVALSHVLGVPTPIVGAGRTDTGVHASGQVIAFDADWRHSPDALLTTLNNELPSDIALLSLQVAAADFHPRHHAQTRIYAYRVAARRVRHPLLARYAWIVRPPLDLAALQAAAAVLLGKHDFATFGKPPVGENTVRELFTSQWTRESSPYGELLTYRIEATAFLQHMVRRIVRMLVDVGRGWLSHEQFVMAFAQANLKAAGKPAPPQGLVLEAVTYPPSLEQHVNNQS